MDITDRTPFPETNCTRRFSRVFLKFSERKYLEEFRDGYIFLRPQGYFSDLEDDVLRMDKFETVDRIYQKENIKSFRMEDNETRKVYDLELDGPVLLNMGKRAYNIFCMYSIKSSIVGCPNVDPRNFAFGDSFVLILNSQEFINRVREASAKFRFGFDCHVVEYFDPGTYSGEVGPFRKPNNFEYQREFRTIITPGTVGPVKLKIHTLRDITTEIFPSSEINGLIECNPSIV